jgi:hypothetical protein
MIKLLKPLHRVVLKSLDISISLFIVTSILVGNWFALWRMFDFLFLNSGIEERIISFAVGVCGQLALLYHQNDVLAKISESNGIMFVFMSRVVHLICSVVNICFWRTIWMFYDSMSIDDDNSILMNIVQNSVILIALRVYRNCVVAPFVVTMDHDISSTENSTFLRKSVSSNWKFMSEFF